MSQTFYTDRERRIRLGPELGRGGEGNVYEIVDELDLVAKIYKNEISTRERETKLQAMVANPPFDTMKARGHVSIAWPTEILYEDGGDFVGYLMPRIQQAPSIFELYHPKERARSFPGFHRRYFLAVARNIAIALEALHTHNYVFGDFNESNILVSPNALVTFIDTDSYQVTDRNGQVHRCLVGKPEFTSPELQGQDFKSIDRLPTHDQFGLGIMIFYLLMEGFHPFQGRLADTTLSISQVDLYCIKRGIFPYQHNSEVLPSPNSPPFDILHPNLQKHFIRCFIDGHKTPTARPTPQDWQKALEQAEQDQIQCDRDNNHYYSNHLTNCPWCHFELQQNQTPVGIQKRMPIPPNSTPSPSPPMAASNPTVKLKPTPPSPTPPSSPTVPIVGSVAKPIPTTSSTLSSSPTHFKGIPIIVGGLGGLAMIFFLALISSISSILGSILSGAILSVAILAVSFQLAAKASRSVGRIVTVTGGVILGAVAYQFSNSFMIMIIILAVCLFLATKASHRIGGIIFIGSGLIYSAYVFYLVAESPAWAYLMLILFGAILGGVIGNLSLLSSLNSIAVTFLAIGWLLCPSSLMWSTGVSKSIFYPDERALTTVGVGEIPSITPRLEVVTGPTATATSTPESIKTLAPTLTPLIINPTKPVEAEATPSSVSEIDRLCGIDVYTVVDGDTLSGIAQFYWGKSSAYPSIVEATKKAHEIDTSFLSDPSVLRPGKKLCIPKISNLESMPAALNQSPPSPIPFGGYNPEHPTVKFVETEIHLVHYREGSLTTCVSRAGLKDLWWERLGNKYIIGPYRGDFLWIDDNGINRVVRFEVQNSTLVLVREESFEKFPDNREFLTYSEAMQMFEKGEILYNDGPPRGNPECD